LWLNADVLAVEDVLVAEIRREVHRELGIPGYCVLVSATHSHSGPPTVHLTGCGEYNAAYVEWFKQRLLQAAREAIAAPEPCGLVVAQGTCDLAVDRHRSAGPHADRRVAAVGWRRSDGTFKAALLNYGMHAVCLCTREISADWPGEAARILSQELPGGPTILAFSGACGNTNPPAVGVTPQQMRDWGRQVAHSVLPQLHGAAVISDRRPLLQTAFAEVFLPRENWTDDEILQHAAKCLADPAGRREFGNIFSLAVETWRKTMIGQREHGMTALPPASLAVVALGPVVLVTVNAEVFSQFNDLIAPGGGRSGYAIGCTNGMLGYLPTAEAYDEGGYEVLWSMFFYNHPRLARGSLERLAEHARRLMNERRMVEIQHPH
jgi:hypothetical protein